MLATSPAKPASPAAFREELGRLKDKFENDKYSDTTEGILIKLKSDKMPRNEFLLLNNTLIAWGAKYTYSTETYHFPPEQLQENGRAEQLKRILLTDLVPGPNPRLNIDALSVVDLLKDIGDNGLRERIKVRPSKRVKGVKRKYEVIDGNRRVKVAELLYWRDIPAVVKEMSDAEANVTAFVVNNNRNGFTDEERGRWFKHLMEDFPYDFPNIRALAPHVGLSKSRVDQLIKYYEDNLPKVKLNVSTQVDMDDPTISPQPSVPLLSEGITRQIRMAPPEIRDQLQKETVEKKLTALQVKLRADELKWNYDLAHAPKEVQGKFSEAAFAMPEKIKQIHKILTGKDLVMPKLATEEDRIKACEAALKGLRDQAQKEYKKEEAKKKAFEKTLSQYFEIDFREGIKIVVDKFGRQDPETSARLAYKLAAKAVKDLTPERLKQHLDELYEEFHGVILTK